MNESPRLGIIAHLLSPIESGTPFGGLTPYFRLLAERANASGWQCYLFSPRDVLRQRRTIWAWIRSDAGWERKFVALPHVVYTRLAVLSGEDGEILRWLRSEGAADFINQPEADDITQDQWRLFQVLQSHPSLTAHIPEITLLKDQGPSVQLLESSGLVHVTPRYRSTGRGRIVLSRQAEVIQLRHERPGTAVNRTIRTSDILRTKVEQLLGESVVAPYVEPLRFEDCAVFVRSLWQRGRTGRWQETGAILRLGQPSAQTYQGFTAGLLDRYQESLQALIGKQLKAVRYQLQSTSQVVAELLSKRSHGVGELTIDYMLTKRATIQIVDVSTTLGIESVQRLPTPEVKREALRATLGYAAVLLEQSQPLLSQTMAANSAIERVSAK